MLQGIRTEIERTVEDMSFQNYNALYTYIDNIFGNIKQNRLNKIKDNYILFDCLYDVEAENNTLIFVQYSSLRSL